MKSLSDRMPEFERSLLNQPLESTPLTALDRAAARGWRVIDGKAMNVKSEEERREGIRGSGERK